MARLRQRDLTLTGRFGAPFLEDKHMTTKIEGALYEARTTIYINGRMVPPGAEVEYDGLPGSNLIPLNAKAKAAVAEQEKLRKTRYEGDDATERYQAQQKAIREADDKRLGKDVSEAEPTPDPDPTLLKHAEQAKKDTAKAERDDTDIHGVKMTGEQTNTQRSSRDNTPADKSKPDSAKAK